MFKKFLVVLLVVISLPSRAETTSLVKNFELGVAVGSPIVMGITMGYWGDEFPGVVRLTLGLGSQLDLGYCVTCSNPDNRKVFVGLSAGTIGYLGISDRELYTLGPTVCLKLGDFFVQGGPAVGMVANTPSKKFFSFLPGSHFIVQGQVGYSLFF